MFLSFGIFDSYRHVFEDLNLKPRSIMQLFLFLTSTFSARNSTTIVIESARLDHVAMIRLVLFHGSSTQAAHAQAHQARQASRVQLRLGVGRVESE